MESFLVKADRGRGVHGADRLGLDYWTERNWSSVEDTTVARYAAARDRELAALHADPELARLHRAAVAWRRERFEALMLDEPARALMGRLMMTPPAQPLSPEAAAFLVGYARRAQAEAR
jgi:hypothetical protein